MCFPQFIPVVGLVAGASGKGPNQIARILMKDSILTPANYTYRKYGVSHSTLDTTLPFSWSQNTIKGILENKVYLGHTEGLRSTSISYKNKKKVIKPENEHVLVKNTHEPLISQELSFRSHTDSLHNRIRLCNIYFSNKT